MMFAAMDQFRTLWAEEIGGAPPILFNFMNNFYGMGGQPVGETMGFGCWRASAWASTPMRCTPSASMASTRWPWPTPSQRKRRILEAGAGPVLLDTITYRFSGHSPSDASSYRDQGRDRALAAARFADRLSRTT